MWKFTKADSFILTGLVSSIVGVDLILMFALSRINGRSINLCHFQGMAVGVMVVFPLLRDVCRHYNSICLHYNKKTGRNQSQTLEGSVAVVFSEWYVEQRRAEIFEEEKKTWEWQDRTGVGDSLRAKGRSLEKSVEVWVSCDMLLKTSPLYLLEEKLRLLKKTDRKRKTKAL